MDLIQPLWKVQIDDSVQHGLEQALNSGAPIGIKDLTK